MTASNLKKTCKSCGKTKVLAAYYGAHENRDGYNNRCKECVKSYQKGYRKRPSVKKRNKIYQRNWARLHYHGTEAHKVASKKWARKYPEKVKIMWNKWRINNPDKMAHIKARRYARERGAEGNHTLDEWDNLKKAFNSKCAFCGEKKERLTKDHIIPLSKGGTDYIKNIQPLCASCNARKKDKL